MSELIYNELIRLRNRLREESKAKEKPLVLEDKDVLKISERMPKTKEELLKIAKMDYRYVDSFLFVINNLELNKNRYLAMNSNVKDTINELEKKLVDINRRNRMLYFPKIPVTAYDLCLSSADPYDLLFRHKTFKIMQGNETFQYFNKIYREATKNYRDHGFLDLYVGYPFIKGKLDDDFYIHAPLALFPITITKDIDNISIKLDTKREVTYNSHLILANYKFKGVSRPLPNCNVDNLEANTFMTNLINFYENEGITFYIKRDALKKFIPIKDDELKYHRIGDYSLEGYAVLGRFSSYSTIIQHDFDLMLSEGVTTNNLNKLLDNNESNNVEIDDDSEINYVGDLNSSQEYVLKTINNKDVLVVEGPPGTGKSQTITSLVTNFMFNNKNVLLVSEKKAALDVVYSRLGYLNKYAIQIDDINDKESFYKFLQYMFKDDEVIDCNKEDIDKINEQIAFYMSKFKKINEFLYDNNSLNIPLYKLYQNSYNYDLSKPSSNKEFEVLNKINEEINLDSFTYDKANSAYTFLSDENVLEKLLVYKKCENTYLFELREDLSSVDLVDLRSHIRNLNVIVDEFNKKNRIARIFKKGKVKKELYKFVNKYYSKSSRKKAKKLIETNILIDLVDDYENLISAKKIYQTVNKDTDIYLDALVKVVENLTHIYSEANLKLFNYIKYKMITKLELNNTNILADITNYNEIVSNLDSLLKQKNELVYKYVKKISVESINEIKNSKNYTDMNHNIYSEKRKFNLNRFISKYYKELVTGVKVWMMTPEVVSEVFPLFETSFDLVIFDEASQLYIEKSLPAIFRAKKVVIAGDSKQLRPSSLGSGRLLYDFDEYSVDNIALEEESLLDVARYKVLPPVVLNFHYRSNYEELINFSNYAFYDENLYVSPNTCEKKEKAIEVIKIDNGTWLNRVNREEAYKVVKVLKDFLTNRKNNETVGIITFNSQQRDLIEDLIDEESLKDSEFGLLVKQELERKDNGEDIGLFVKNIENVQGDERDLIIFSIAYAKGENGRLVHNFGWLNQKGGENRLNVAITRAKKKIIIVTSISPSDLKVESFQNNGPKYLKNYLEYAFLISNNDILNAKQTLYKFNKENQNVNIKDVMIADVYKEISRLGFEVVTNVGVGKYMIDLAIKQRGKYILGIEFDTKLAKDKDNYRERDYFRRKYLSSRNWNIYRVYSALWWKNKEDELSKICAYLREICSKNTYEI